MNSQEEIKDGFRLVYLNPQFRSIDKVELFDIEGALRQVQYHGSDESLLDLSGYNKYGWEFLVKERGINDMDPLNSLDIKERKDIGARLSDIEGVRKSFFPTCDFSEGIPGGDITYFGSIMVGQQKLIMIRVGQGIKTMRLYDTTDTISPDEPKILVEFDSKNIPVYKILWLVITSGGERSVGDIGLSYLTWLDSKNPNRNLRKYLLSEADLHNVPSVIGTNGIGELMDRSSRTLLGNEVLQKHPALDNMTTKFRALINSRVWLSGVTYGAGEIVKYAGREWKSLRHGNRGNIPTLSNAWIVNTGNTSSIVKCYVVIQEDDNTNPEVATVTPGIFTKPRNVGTGRTFDITYSDGYVLSDIYKDTGQYTFGTGISKELSDYRAYLDNGRNFNLTIHNITDKLEDTDSSISKNLQFDFTRYYSKFRFFILSDRTSDGNNGVITPDEGITVIGEDGNDIDRVVIRNGEQIIDSYYPIPLGSRFKVDYEYTLSQAVFENAKTEYVLKTNGTDTTIDSEDLVMTRVTENMETDKTISDSNGTVVYVSPGRNKIHLVMTDKLDRPSDRNLDIIITSKIYTFRLLDYIGFYVNRTVIEGDSDTSIEYKLYPIDGDFSRPINIQVSGGGATRTFKYYGASLGENFDSTYVTFGQDNTSSRSYYRLLVNNRTGDKVTSDMDFKVWR